MLVAGPTAAAESVEKAPPPAPYKKVSELVKLPDFLPGIGTLYVDPKTLPAGPFLAYDHAGKLVSTIYMIPIKDFDGHKTMRRSKGARRQRRPRFFVLQRWPSRCAGTSLSHRAVACDESAGEAGREVSGC